MRDPLKPLGKAIKAQRLKVGLTQEQLAEKAGMHTTYVSGVERGVFNISVVKLARLAAGLNVKLSELLEGV